MLKYHHIFYILYTYFNVLCHFSPLVENLATDGQDPTTHIPEDLSEKTDSSASAMFVPLELVH